MPLFERPQVIQSLFAELTSDTTTTSTTFVDMGLSITIVTDNNPVMCWFSTAGDNTGIAGNSFQLVIDGVAQVGAKYRVVGTGSGGSTAIVFKSAGLTIGSHTVKIQWLTSAGTAQTRPATLIQEHASLLVEEITV